MVNGIEAGLVNTQRFNLGTMVDMIKKISELDEKQMTIAQHFFDYYKENK